MGHPFYSEVLDGIERALSVGNYDLLLPPRADSRPADYGAALQRRHVAGTIMVAIDVDDARVRALIDADLPTVFIDHAISGAHATSIKPDNRAGGRQVAHHLLRLGHRRIVIFRGHPTSLASQERLLGCRDVFDAAGLGPDAVVVQPSDFSRGGAYRDALAFFDAPLDRTAVIAQSDEMAIGILRALRERGLCVPDDVSLVGFDDLDLCLYMDPPLTSVHVDRGALGQRAVHLLLDMIDGREVIAPVTIPAQLIERASSAPPHFSMDAGGAS